MCAEDGRFNPCHSRFARPRQPVVKHAARSSRDYEPLTRVFKPITTAPWHGLRQPGGNSPVGSLSFEASNGSRQDRCRVGPRVCGSTPSLCLCVSKPPMKRPMSACASSICIASAWCCGARFAACAWRSICRSRLFAAWPSGFTAKPGAPPDAIAVVLEHADPALSLPLFSAPESDDIVAEWQSWGRVLGLPLLVAEDDGNLREPFARLGARAHRSAGLAPPPPQRHRPPPAVAAFAPPSRQRCRQRRWCIAASARSSRGIRSSADARLHAPRRATIRQTGSIRHRGRI